MTDDFDRTKILGSISGDRSSLLEEHERLTREVIEHVKSALRYAAGGFGTGDLEQAGSKLVLLLNHGRDWEMALTQQTDLLDEANRDLDDARGEAQAGPRPQLVDGDAADPHLSRSWWPASDEPYSHQADGVNEQLPVPAPLPTSEPGNQPDPPDLMEALKESLQCPARTMPPPGAPVGLEWPRCVLPVNHDGPHSVLR